ncbi:hypothetical protein AVEN_112010-1 [Araneus ventricosus]|uniref:Uncharacterized protein n=1 Tax=Araneus ventricosus TaxID=182803 RepID=A0A4Y2I010_ARAVE|nr:hypothetical protein AVEN_112010-1 [Araneus ventricosus]
MKTETECIQNTDVQKLQPNDGPQHVTFAVEMLSPIENEHYFLNRVMFSDEATCHLSNKVNKHNCIIWGSENPHVEQEVERKSPKINMIGHGGPIAWPPRSPDVIPFDFFGYVKNKICSMEIKYVENLRASITFATVTTEMLRRTWLELDYRLDILRAAKAAHVEVH